MNRYQNILIFYWIKIGFIMYAGFQLNPKGIVEHSLMILSIIGPLMLWFALTLLFKKKVNRIVLLLLIFVVTIWLYGHLLYYRFYADFLTLPILFQVGNVGGLSRSTWELFSPWDLLLFADIIILGWLLFRQKSIRFPKIETHHYIRNACFITITVMIAALFYKPHLFEENYNRSQFVSTLGLFTYQAFDFIQSLLAPSQQVTSDKNDTSSMENYIIEREANGSV